MKIHIETGKYVVAVSGGVDSVALLHGLVQLPGLELVVAHFDHGIRADSRDDRLLVEVLAAKHDLPFFYEDGRLGPRASEAAARQARYDFLRKVQAENQAQAIITAHHQDDVLETVIINLLRGTGRKGLSSLNSRAGLERPLLRIPKSQIIDYARQNGLQWREDSTNRDQAYLRNYVRHQILPRFDQSAREQLLEMIENNARNTREVDTLLVKYLPSVSVKNLKRYDFVMLPHEVALEVMAAWLRSHDLRDFDSLTLERLVTAGKTARPGSRFDVLRKVSMKVSDDDLALVSAER
jgi:tRNA(Ile)-lysidine synthetase-like protein